MDSLVENVQSLAKMADEAGRKKLIDTLTSAALSIERPQDMMQRLLYLHVYISVVRAANDLKLFNIIRDSAEPVGAEYVAGKAGSAPRLTARLLRYLASVGALKETGADTYTANEATQTLAEPAWQSAVYHNFDGIGPCFIAMPDFIKEHGYQDIEDPADCPFTKAHQASDAAFNWLPTGNPWLFGHFTQFMTVQRDGMPTWLDQYPYRETLVGLGREQALFVDVGGSVGHMSVALRKALPATITNRIIVQDQPQVLPAAIQHPGVEYMEYDFWTPQPIAGARIYYLRNIVHDWPDAKATEILRNQKSAMAPDSVLLIDDMVMPDTGAHWQATQLDMVMMSALASCERSRSQHEKVITDAGLKINRIYQYTTSLSDCIIECVPA